MTEAMKPEIDFNSPKVKELCEKFQKGVEELYGLQNSSAMEKHIFHSLMLTGKAEIKL